YHTAEQTGDRTAVGPAKICNRHSRGRRGLVRGTLFLGQAQRDNRAGEVAAGPAERAGATAGRDQPEDDLDAAAATARGAAAASVGGNAGQARCPAARAGP